ncbi:MAG TPA: phage major capsid protein [Clostridia bacterium]|nr:phage major capsid protein [Clostridia bacterium]
MKRKHIARFQQEFRGSRILSFLGLNLLTRTFPVLAVMLVAFGVYAFAAGEHNTAGILMASTAPIMLPVETKEFLDKELKGLREQLGTFTEDAQKQIKANGTMAEETKTKLDKTLTEIAETRDRIKGIEDKLSKSTSLGDGPESKTLGAQVIESAEFKDFASKGSKSSGRIMVVGGFNRKTAIVNATGQNQPLVPAQRVPGIVAPMVQRLFLRDLLNTVPATSNSIEFVRENSSTNAAAPQGKGSSPQVYENVSKAESALSFALTNEPVQTVAHWIPASRQVLDDAPSLGGYIDGRMRYMQALKVEDQLLNGTGTSGDLNGLVTQATDYDTDLTVSGDTIIDKLRHVLLQIELANGFTNVVVLNPTQWHDIELLKTTGTASSGQYIFGNPHAVTTPIIWGRNVIPTPSMVNGKFLAGDTQMACDLYDRQQASIEISREHSDFFIKNMVAILCEERLALVVYRPDALVYGSF